jgi:hypothetical protein
MDIKIDVVERCQSFGQVGECYVQKNNLIDFIVDSTATVKIPTFLGRMVIVDDGMPAAAGVFEIVW